MSHTRPGAAMYSGDVKSPNWLEASLAWLTPKQPSSPAPPPSAYTAGDYQPASPEPQTRQQQQQQQYQQQQQHAHPQQYQQRLPPEYIDDDVPMYELPPRHARSPPPRLREAEPDAMLRSPESYAQHRPGAVAQWQKPPPPPLPQQQQRSQPAATPRNSSPARTALAPRDENTPLPPRGAAAPAASTALSASDMAAARARSDARGRHRSNSPRGDARGSTMHVSARSNASSVGSSMRGGSSQQFDRSQRMPFGSSTPRFAADAAPRREPQPHPAVVRAIEEAAPLAKERARGLHAAYAQCAALRRMLTALRVNRLLTRWRVAVNILCHEETHAAAHRARLALEQAIVEEHKRSERALVEEKKDSLRKAHLFGLIKQSEANEAKSLAQYFATWCTTVQLLEGETAVQAEAAARAQANRTRERLSDALTSKVAELASVKRMVQKPTLLERELFETQAELTRSKDELADALRKLKAQERRAMMAEERVAAIHVEMGKERERHRRELANAQHGVSAQHGAHHGAHGPRSSSPAHGRAGQTVAQQATAFHASTASINSHGGHGHGPSSHGAGRHGDTHDVESLRSSLSASIAERQKLDNKLDGLRAKVHSLSEARSRSRVARVQALLMLRMHSRMGPALRRWQAASLAVDASDPGRAGASAALLPSDSSTGGALAAAGAAHVGEQRQSRIIALQRELLDREAQLGAAHQASLKWREERAALTQQLTAAQTDAQASKARMADAALAAAAAAEKEVRVELTSAQKALKELRGRMADMEGRLERSDRELHAAREVASAKEQEAQQAVADADAARRAENNAAIAREEMEDARVSEAEHSAGRIAELEAAVEESRAGAANALKNKPLTMQREMRDRQKEVEALRAQLAELSKKYMVQQKRMNDAEARMEGLQKEVAQHRNKSTHQLRFALQNSPAATPRGGGGGSPMPSGQHALSSGGAFGSPVPSPRGERESPVPATNSTARARATSPRADARPMSPRARAPSAAPLSVTALGAGSPPAPAPYCPTGAGERPARPARSRMPPTAPSAR